MRKGNSFFAVALLVFFIAPFGFGQLTGSIRGKITDDAGNPLPGVRATLTSPSMQGTKSFVSTLEGDFRFPTLPPGTYSMKTELSGFNTLERPGILVSVGATTTVSVQMTPSPLNEQVTVTAPSPIVDIMASNIKLTVTREVAMAIPIRRDVLDIFQFAPTGVPMTSDNDYMKSTSVAGGALEQSKIAIDGIALVDPSRGYVMADLSFDSIDEVEIAIGGHKAEVGQASAGFVNVVTKSGGNSFSGSLTVGASGKSLTEVIAPQDQIIGFGLAAPQIKNYKYDIGASFGGPIIKDKVWFFIAPRYSSFEQSTYFIPFTDPQGYAHPAYNYRSHSSPILGKITAQLAKNVKWFVTFQWNKNYDFPEYWASVKPYSPLESQKVNNDSTPLLSSGLTYILNQNTFVDAHLGVALRDMYLPFTNAWEGPVGRPHYIDKTTLWEWGGGDRPIYDYKRNEINFSLGITRFQDAFLGTDHEFKAGAEYSRATSDRQGAWPYPYTYYWNNGTPWYNGDVTPYKGQVRIWSGSIDADNLRSFKAAMWRTSFFLQDTFTVGKRLTVNLGVRYDESHGSVPARHWEGWNDIYNNGLANVILPEIFMPSGSTLDTPEVKDLLVYKFLSPRIGLSYDLFGSGKTVFKASFASYGDALFTTTLENVIPIQEMSVTFTWYDDNHNGLLDLPTLDRYVPGSYAPYVTDVQAVRNQIASTIKVPRTAEATVGIVQQITTDFSISLNGMYKHATNMLGARNLNIPKDSEWWVPYSVTDPGQDGLFGSGDDKPLTVYMLRSDAPTNFIQRNSIDEAWRKYWGVNMIFNKRMSHGWLFAGSVALSKSWGNFPNGYLNYSGSQNFWDPNSDINRQGRSDYDRPVIIKLMSSVEMGSGFTLSGYFRHYSGTHYTRQVTVYFPTKLQNYTPRTASVKVNAESVNTRDMEPSSYLDLRLEKTFRVGGLNLGLFADVFNLMGHWYFTYAQNQLVGGNIYANGTYAKYPNYGKPASINGARELNLGVRIRF